MERFASKSWDSPLPISPKNIKKSKETHELCVKLERREERKTWADSDLEVRHNKIVHQNESHCRWPLPLVFFLPFFSLARLPPHFGGGSSLATSTLTGWSATTVRDDTSGFSFGSSDGSGGSEGGGGRVSPLPAMTSQIFTETSSTSHSCFSTSKISTSGGGLTGSCPPNLPDGGVGSSEQIHWLQM